ncbi:MAG TPA: ACT domain-containing protein [Verrucomicrobiota bacterium]|nr:glycine cleavage system protein R [Verrucomicrobiales bacterium]HRI12732.1 ACT domain-containing protein [Verrucomicrobiota bacterium]
MHSSLVMTVIGPDRPGLVDTLATLIAQHEGNWTESRMAHLSGQFAGILQVVVPSANVAALQKDLLSLASSGLRVSAVSDRPTPAGAGLPELALELLGHDRPGIVREIAKALAECGVNVEELHTEVQSAPMSGEALFRAQARLRLPANGDVTALRQQLARAAERLEVEVTLSNR